MNFIFSMKRNNLSLVSRSRTAFLAQGVIACSSITPCAEKAVWLRETNLSWPDRYFCAGELSPDFSSYVYWYKHRGLCRASLEKEVEQLATCGILPIATILLLLHD